MTETNPLAEYAATLKAMRAEAREADKPGLELALTALGEDAGLGGFEDEFATDADMMQEMPPEPTRKGVLGTAAGSGALIILWAAQQFGIEMELEVAVAIAGLLGAAVAYFHRED